MTDITAKLAEALEDALSIFHPEPGENHLAPKWAERAGEALSAYHQHTKAQAGGMEGAWSKFVDGLSGLAPWLRVMALDRSLGDGNNRAMIAWADAAESLMHARAALASAPAAAQGLVTVNPAPNASVPMRPTGFNAAVQVKEPAHVCGSSGFGLGMDDFCPACQAHDAEMARKRETPAQAFERGRLQGMSQANALWEMAKTSEAADKPAALIALNDKTRSDVDEAIRKLRELDGKEVELWQWWAVVCMALWKAYQLGAATTQPTHEQAKAEMAKAEQAVPVAWRTDAPASEDEQGRQLDLAREDQRLFGHGVTVNGWRVPAPLVSMLASSPATERRPLPDSELAALAYKGYDDYWTENSLGDEQEAWARSAKTVLAAHGITAGTTEQAKEQNHE